MEHGDQVTAATDLDTTNGFHIPAGTAGTVAEDRGSNLVVFFENDTVASLNEQDLLPA
jgi:hypothetical protein